ncbi:MAG: stage II sporulation protein M [Asticcacaulis sp.]
MAEEPPVEPAAAPPPLRLKSQKFREARQGDWRALNAALDRAERQGMGSFSVDDILNLPVLYRSAMSSLSMAQSISLDRNMITYLQALCARAYVNIYGPQTRLKTVLSDFFGRDWPQGVRRLRAEIALSFALVLLGLVTGWAICAHDQSWYSIFMGGMSEGRTPDASVAELKATLGHSSKDAMLSPFAVFLMTHNTRVAIMAFAFGVIFGIPTFGLMLMTGLQMGALMWLFASKGLGIDLFAWLSIHGTTEITAFTIAGACGFHLARRLMFPGDLSRRLALVEAGRVTGTVMIGVAVMLTIAGCLEGIGRQTIVEPVFRFAIGGLMLALWLAFFIGVGRVSKAASNG